MELMARPGEDCPHPDRLPMLYFEAESGKVQRLCVSCKEALEGLAKEALERRVSRAEVAAVMLPLGWEDKDVRVYYRDLKGTPWWRRLQWRFS